jgi:hypothetical protein
MSLSFKVPTTIYKEIAEYDISKPKDLTAPPRNPAPARVVKPKNFGTPYDLLPTNIISTEGQKTIVDRIHTKVSVIPRSHHRKEDSIVNISNKPKAIVGFFGVFWYSFWIIENDENYLMGLKIYVRNIVSYKNNSAFSEFLRSLNINIDEVVTEEILNATKKPKDIEFTKKVSLEDLKKGKYYSTYNYSYGGSSSTFNTELIQHLRKKVPTWKNTNTAYWYRDSISNLMHRISNNPYKELFQKRLRNELFATHQKFKENELNLETFYDLLADKYKEKFNTPYVRKVINESIDSINRYYNNPANESQDTFNNHINDLIYRINFVAKILEVYDNLSVDQINSLFSVSFIDTARRPLSFEVPFNGKIKEWLNKNVPFKSAFNMIKTDCHLFRDSISMLGTVLSKKPDLKYEERYRVNTFHDYIMAEQWKLNNKDGPLPQYLIPQPIKINNDWTFFQPSSIHQLALWGREARNCVGGTYYINGIKDKRHFIVLAMKNHVPTFTIQLVLRGANLEVSQIKKSSNAALNNQEMKEYENLFSNLMKVREEQIKQEELNKVEAQVAVEGA